MALPTAGEIAELPPTTMKPLGRRLPLAGGRWFRLAPYPLLRLAICRLNGVEAQPAIRCTSIHASSSLPAGP